MSVQFIKSARKGKPVTWYIYAWRGGPRVRTVVSPRKPTLTPADHARIGQLAASDRSHDPALMIASLREWCPADPKKEGSAEWAGLSDNTKRVWNPHVDLIEARWGSKPLSVWDDPRMVQKVIDWRDTRKDTPRTADIGIDVLKAFLEFARLRGRVRINVADKIPALYHGADRAEIVWTQDDIDRFTAKAEELKRTQVLDGLRLAAVTGLRRADLVTLTWDQVGEFAIVKKALKISRRKRRRVTIPQTPQLEALLAELRTRHRRDGVNTVLVNSLGKSWTEASFGGSFCRIRDAAAIQHIEDGEDPRNKTLHDVRGTFCTLLLTEWDLTDEEAADIVGWSPARVATIRKVYVDQRQVVVALGKRIAAKQIAKQTGGGAGN
ncbi:tyrosine-type recombinase/integrase [Sphingomonas koreensis]